MYFNFFFLNDRLKILLVLFRFAGYIGNMNGFNIISLVVKADNISAPLPLGTCSKMAVDIMTQFVIFDNPHER